MNSVYLPTGPARPEIINRIRRMLESVDASVPWVVEIRPHKPVRSDAQNRYLWGVCYPTICKTLQGWDAEDVHEYCLGEHFGWETIEAFGKKRLRPIRRSAKLNKQEFSDFVAFIQRRMAEHGIVIPDPTDA